MADRLVFPFAAIPGCRSAKEALLAIAVNPRIGGLLLCGQKGTAKSTLVRGLGDLIPDTPFTELPLNITEDRLVGTLHLEDVLRTGRRCLQQGLLGQADGGILYVDEINLLSEHIASCLLDPAASGVNVVEREGVSRVHNARFQLVGTMNPEEGPLRPGLLDRFGLYVEIRGIEDIGVRADIIRRAIAFEQNRAGFIGQWRDETAALRRSIDTARRLLGRAEAEEPLLRYAAMLSRQAGCAGHRADVITVETARALAALQGRTAVTRDDVTRAAGYALPHRMRQPTDPPPSHKEEPARSPEEQPASPMNEEPSGDTAPGSADPDSASRDSSPTSGRPSSSPPRSPEAPSQAPDMDLPVPGSVLRRRQGSGKRLKTRSDTRQGRYVRYRIPHGKTRDIALDATLRATAPYQKHRTDKELAVAVRPSDIREKVRERRTGCMVLFVVDTSGSMGARRRMGAVKGAIVSMLSDAYRKRDRVGLVAFRGDGARLLLSMTRSVDLAHRHLSALPTGGKTPLAHGLSQALELLRAYRIKEPDALQYLVLVTDGRTNVPLVSNDATGDALMMARKIRYEGIPALVLDTEEGFIRLEMAKDIARNMGAEYLRLTQISASAVGGAVHSLVSNH